MKEFSTTGVIFILDYKNKKSSKIDVPLRARFFRPLDTGYRSHKLAERLKQYGSNVLLLCLALLLCSKNKYQ
jgi:hypothetical protein